MTVSERSRMPLEDEGNAKNLRLLVSRFLLTGIVDPPNPPLMIFPYSLLAALK